MKIIDYQLMKIQYEQERLQLCIAVLEHEALTIEQYQARRISKEAQVITNQMRRPSIAEQLATMNALGAKISVRPHPPAL